MKLGWTFLHVAHLLGIVVFFGELFELFTHENVYTVNPASESLI